ASGARVWDIDGNEYVDISMGFGGLLFGHSPAFITEALQSQVTKGLQLGLQSNFAGQTAGLVCEITGTERCFFVNSGTEAVMTAIRLARTVTGRSKLAMFNGSYHGFHDEALVRAVAGPPGQPPRTIAMAPGVSPHVTDAVLVL